MTALGGELRILACAAAGTAALLVLGGCSAGVSTGATAVSESELEARLTEMITEEAGQAPDDIDCPGDLELEMSATTTCLLTAGTDELDVDVTITEVDGEDARFEYEIEQIKDESTSAPESAGPDDPDDPADPGRA